jgi:hypothetical protein
MSLKNPLNEIFISIDIEADGPIPIKNSMIAIGAVAFTPRGLLPLSSFEIALRPLDTATADPDTMNWWQSSEKNRRAWDYLHRNIGLQDIHGGLVPQNPREAMERFNTWVENVAYLYKSRPIFAGFPASFDHMFVYVYSHYLLGKCPFKFSSWDAKSYAMALIKSSFSDSIKKKWPREWFKGTGKHTHTPLADATEQAKLFIAMMQENLGIK